MQMKQTLLIYSYNAKFNTMIILLKSFDKKLGNITK